MLPSRHLTVRAEMDVTYRFHNRPVIAAGTLYWDILRLFSELKLGLQASLKKYPDIVSMALDTWGCDFGFIDKNGKLLGNPVTYRDKPRHDRSARLYKALPRRELFQPAPAPPPRSWVSTSCSPTSAAMPPRCGKATACS